MGKILETTATIHYRDGRRPFTLRRVRNNSTPQQIHAGMAQIVGLRTNWALPSHFTRRVNVELDN